MPPRWNLLATGAALVLARAAALEIQPMDRDGQLRLNDTFANGVAVVNIDNGFGAACMASAINHL